MIRDRPIGNERRLRVQGLVELNGCTRKFSEKEATLNFLGQVLSAFERLLVVDTGDRQSRRAELASAGGSTRGARPETFVERRLAA